MFNEVTLRCWLIFYLDTRKCWIGTRDLFENERLFIDMLKIRKGNKNFKKYFFNCYDHFWVLVFIPNNVDGQAINSVKMNSIVYFQTRFDLIIHNKIYSILSLKNLCLQHFDPTGLDFHREKGS